MWFDKKNDNSNFTTRTFQMYGQEAIHNEFNNVVSTTIRKLFVKCWEILGWGFQSSGIGINQDLINYVLDHESKLFVTIVEQGNKKYIITADEIRDVMKSFETRYTQHKVPQTVIPLLKFKEM